MSTQLEDEAQRHYHIHYAQGSSVIILMLMSPLKRSAGLCPVSFKYLACIVHMLAIVDSSTTYEYI